MEQPSVKLVYLRSILQAELHILRWKVANYMIGVLEL